jgi:hypothetical protein
MRQAPSMPADRGQVVALTQIPRADAKDRGQPDGKLVNPSESDNCKFRENFVDLLPKFGRATPNRKVRRISLHLALPVTPINLISLSG